MVRMSGSRAATRLGVKVRLTSLRMRVCRGGSMAMRIGLASNQAGSTASIIGPSRDEKVSQSRWASSTSA